MYVCVCVYQRNENQYFPSYMVIKLHYIKMLNIILSCIYFMCIFGKNT